MLGKLVGELVAVVVMDVQGDSIRIEDVVVAKDLRRKRIGKYMLDEVSRLAAKLERGRVVVAPNPDREFFRRCGFDEDGEWMVRRVGP